jgi:uncharacterized repeat protein (TIGR01451 family)
MRRVLFFLLVALVAATCFAAPTVAAPLPGSAFETGDGDQGDGLGLDWQGGVAAGVVRESPDANDDCFVGGVKELTPNQWAFDRSAGGCTPGKSNLRVAFANPESAPATTFGHFAFFRNDTTGNSFLTFELNQTGASWTNATGTTIPCRSTGDLLLSFEVGGSSLTTSLYRWTGDGSGPATCRDGANGTFTGSGAIPAGRFQGAMNPAAIMNYVNPAAYGATFPGNAFGEAAIDIPAVLRGMGASPCFGFLQMQVHSRSSSSISSAMIDYTSPVPVHIQSCAVTGTQYQDTNGSGARDAGEPGLAGFRMYVDLDDDGTRDPGEPSGVSDASGFYRILDVPAGSARIRQEPKAGWRCSQPSPCSYARSFTSSGNSAGNDFGNLGPSTASGIAFDDSDGDAIRDAGEPGLPDATLYADLDDDGVRDAGEPAATSGGDGAWTITDIPAGTYRVRPVTAAARTCTTPATCSSQQTFVSGSAATGLVFGSYAGATVGGTVTESGGAPIAGVQVFLDADGDGAFDFGERQTTAATSGAWSIGALPPGTYAARATLPSSSWYCAGVCEHAVAVTSGLTSAGRDFVLARYATVSGTTFDDVDGDGVRDAGDAGVAGFTTWVDYDGDNALDAGEPSALSAGTGGYTITGVRAGSWTLRQQPNGAYACTFPAPCTYAIALASNGAAAARDFGQHVDRSVSGTVFNDANANATVPEAGEAGVAGWTVYSDANSNGARDAGEPAAVTNSLGQYTLTGLANGSYRVRLVGQAGWTCSAPASCANTGSIGSGQSDTQRNFGVWGRATVSGVVHEDGDANGTGDAPLAGRTVYVDANGNSAHDAGEPSGTSDGSGAWSIGGLDPGSYTIRQVLPSGWTCSSPAPCSYTVATASGPLGGRDFASHTTGSVAGSVAEDTDADGDGDTPLAGRTVFLDGDGDGAHDAGEPATTSGATGAWTLSGLTPGTRTIRQVVPAGWTQSAPAGAHTVAVTSGSAAGGRDFASYTTGSISGSAFEDADFDGSAAEAGDQALAGRALYLDLDGDGGRDAGEPQATTSGSGAWSFTGLAPGAYTVRPVLPAGWACSYPSGCAAAVTLASGAAAGGRDFGSYLGASVAGTVFDDLDADGAAREESEPGAAGRRVYLDANGDAVRQAAEPATLTDGAGAYAFTGVTARAWQLRLELASGDSCDSPSPCRRDLALTSGASQTGQDFGVHTTGTISGRLFTDRDADGQAQTFGENDQPERTVYVDADGDGTRDAGERAALTDDRGLYAFTGVEPGVHRVRQVLPDGWTCSRPLPCVRIVTVTSGATAAGNDFSSWTTASFSGVYFEDHDADGEYPEPAEGGVAGRTVYLDADDDGTRDPSEPATTTAGEGRFAFSGLAPGIYVVRSVGQPAGWTCSYPSPCSRTMSLEAAERAQDVDFGAWTTGTVTGTISRDDTASGVSGWTVYADADGDGARDAGEPSTTTAEGGTYALALDPGEHVIRHVAPGGWTCTSPSPCRRAVAVRSSVTESGQDFTTVAGASVRGTVYDDGDGDGARDAGEAGRGGVTVYVDADGDGSPGAGEPSATTGDDGAYSLSLGAGAHEVRIVVPAGAQCDAPCRRTATVAAGEAASDVDFGVWRHGAIDGVVFEDADGDGAPREGGEAGLAGVEVFLDGASVPAATTRGDGAYAITGLTPGEHTLRIRTADGWRCTRPVPCTTTISTASGGTAAADFGAVAVAADLSVVLARTPDDPTAGRPVSWKATVSNAGPFSATGATLTVTLPTGLTNVAWSGATCARSGDVLTCALGDVAVGGTAELTFGGDVGAGRAGSTLPVAARVAAEEPDPDVSDDDAAQAPPVAGVADLRTTATLPPRAGVGTVVELDADVTNHGPSDADGVTVAITLPDGLDAVAAALPADCAVAGRVVTCRAPALAVGAMLRRSIPVRVADRASGPLLARVDAASATPDPTPPDAHGEAELAAIPSADVQVLVTDPLRATPEGYRASLAVVNRGPSRASGVVLTDGPFPGAKVVAVTADGGTCAVEADGSIRCDLGDLEDGGTARITVVLAVDEATDPSTLSLTPRATASESDPSPANNVRTLALPPAAGHPAPEPESEPELVVVAPPTGARGSCGSKRIFPIKVRRLRGQRLVRVTMTLDGVRIKVRRVTGRFTAVIDLRDRPRGEAVVRIRAVSRSGRVLTGVRTYHTCTEEPLMSLPPL